MLEKLVLVVVLEGDQRLFDCLKVKHTYSMLVFIIYSERDRPLSKADVYKLPRHGEVSTIQEQKLVKKLFNQSQLFFRYILYLLLIILLSLLDLLLCFRFSPIIHHKVSVLLRP